MKQALVNALIIMIPVFVMMVATLVEDIKNGR
jgi:hypothetical protein